jgi:NADPH:quinone reductase-like Zn-dependent oxidoreductase
LKAIVQRRYGSPDWLELRDVAKPVVGETDVLVRVHAASVNAADWHLLTGIPYVLRLAFGILRPRRTIPGRDLAGRVETVGGSVTRFRVGDEVFGTPGDELRNIIGTFAEYVVAPETPIVPKPATLTFEQAAAAPQAGVTALQALRTGNVQPGMTVLINGAGGGVGTFAVQIAKALGAEVTGVCSSHGVELVTSLGADHVIDYTREDFTNTGHRYDVIIDLVANRSLTACRRALSQALRASPQPSSSGTPGVSATNPERDGDRAKPQVLGRKGRATPVSPTAHATLRIADLLCSMAYANPRRFDRDRARWTSVRNLPLRPPLASVRGCPT